ncbi:MAG TPA: glycosyltransferase family 1 protein [bacterium]|nr:glycosyltransferase family 1 protein [bacterium]
MKLLVASSTDAMLWTWLREYRPRRQEWQLLVKAGRGGRGLARHVAQIHRSRAASFSTDLARLSRARKRQRYTRAVILCNNNTGDGYDRIRQQAQALAAQVELVMLDGRRLLPDQARREDRRARALVRALRTHARPRIGIDCRTWSPWCAGIGDYVANTVRRVVRLMPDAEFILYQTVQSGAVATGRNVHVATAPEIRLNLAEEQAYYRQAAGHDLDLFHATGPFGPTRRFCPTVLTLHDLSQLRHPEYFYPDRVAHFHRVIRPMLRAADAVVTDSCAIADEAAAAYRVPQRKLLTLPLAATVTPVRGTIRPPYGLRPGYLLYVGTIEPRKNLAQLVDALVPLWRSGAVRQPLVLAGKRGWLQDDLLARIARIPQVRWLGYVPAADLPALMGGAGMFIYLSRYEGFGLPVANAMACGVPVITTPDGALGEVAGDAAMLVDPDDGKGLRTALLRVQRDANWRRELIARGRARVREYSWSANARALTELYRLLLTARGAQKKQCGKNGR